MRPAAANTLTVGSALVCFAAVVVWASTLLVNLRFDFAAIDRSGEPIEVATIDTLATVPHQVRVGLTRVRMDRGQSLVTLNAYIPTGLTHAQSTPAPGEAGDLRRLVPTVAHAPSVDTGFGRRSTVTLSVPIWIVVVAAGIAPAVRVGRWWRRRSWSPTACRRCGYDRRGSADRCPECGAAGR